MVKDTAGFDRPSPGFRLLQGPFERVSFAPIGLGRQSFQLGFTVPHLR